MGKSRNTVGSTTREIVDGVSDLAGVDTLKGEWFGVGRIIEKAMNDTVGDTLRPTLKESMTIDRRKGGPSFLLAVGLIALACGIGVLVLAVLVLVQAGASGTIFLVLALAVVGTSLSIVRRGVRLLRPGELRIDGKGMRLMENGVLTKEIEWGHRIRIAPWVNHALGYNEFYGFRVIEGRTEISLSPNEGWPRDQLRLGILLVLKNGLDHDARVSKDFLKIRGLW